MSGELATLVDRYGDAFAVDPARVRGSLLDALGDLEPEVSLLVSGAETGITAQLIEARGQVTPSLFGDLAQRLVSDRGLTPRGAHWVVDTWAWALAVDEPVDEPVPALTPVATAAERAPAVEDEALFTLSERPPFRLADHVFSVAVLAFVIALVATLVVLSRPDDSPRTAPLGRRPAQVATAAVSVPAVESLSRREAVDRLLAVGLTAQVTSVTSEDATPGTVVEQDPAPGASVRDGQRVRLVVAAPIVRVGRPVDLTFERSQTTVTVTWRRPAEGSKVDGYEIWRDGEMIGTRRADKRTFTDEGLVPGTSHQYSVRAIGENGTAARSRTRNVRLLRPVATPDPVQPQEPVVVAPPPPTNDPPPPPPDPPCTLPPAFC